MAIPHAPSSSVKPSSSSLADETAAGAKGSVMLIIWIPLSVEPVTMEYVPEPIPMMATPHAPPRLVKPASASSTADAGVGDIGMVVSVTVMSIARSGEASIGLSSVPATADDAMSSCAVSSVITDRRCSSVNLTVIVAGSLDAIVAAPASAIRSVSPTSLTKSLVRSTPVELIGFENVIARMPATSSRVADRNSGGDGWAISIIWMALSISDATRAYNLAPIATVTMSDAPPSPSNPSSPSIADATAVGLEGFVMSITCTPPSVADATKAYVEEPIATAAIPRAPASSSNPSLSSLTDETATGSEAFVMSIIWTPLSYSDATRA